MSENSLKIRGKFINKLATKIEDLNDNFILLSQVDKKIFKKMNNQMSEKINNQRGGDSKAANNAILSALKKSQEMKAQQEKLTLSLNKLDNIQGVIKDFSTTFNNIKNIIDSITLGDLNQAKIDQINDLADSDKNTLNNEHITALQGILNSKKYNSYDEFTRDDEVSDDLKEKIDPSGFAILFPPRNTLGDIAMVALATKKAKKLAPPFMDAEDNAEENAEDNAGDSPVAPPVAPLVAPPVTPPVAP